MVYDPKAMSNTKKIFGDKIFYAKSISESLKNSTILVLMVNWKEFHTINNNSFKKLSKIKIIDCRRILAGKELGVEDHAIGIGK